MEALINVSQPIELIGLKISTENQLNEYAKILNDIERAKSKPENERNEYDQNIPAEYDDVASKDAVIASYNLMDATLKLIHERIKTPSFKSAPTPKIT